jgi:hypothetical protein
LRIALGAALAGAALAACATMPDAAPAPSIVADEPLRSLLARSSELPAMLERPEERRIQIVLGLLETGADGRPTLRQSSFRAGAEYFYPASSVKFFAAIAALEKLADMRRETGVPISRDTPLWLYPLFPGEPLVREDPSHLAAPTVTVGHEIRKLAVVSDNEAFNRLYELVGQDGLAASLARAGIPDARIVHRLDEFRSPEENRWYPRVDFLGGVFVHAIPERRSEPLPPPSGDPPAGLLVGDVFYRGDERVEGPLDFSGKNRIALTDLQRGLCKLVRPDADCGGGGSFALEPDDRAFLVEAMSMLPAECTDPRFDPAEHPVGEIKLILSGLQRIQSREKWRYVDKTGWAYGFSIENAYVEDTRTGAGFFLAAVLYTNADGVLNDDEYDYEAVADPFFADLGEVIARAVLGAPAAR